MSKPTGRPQVYALCAGKWSWITDDCHYAFAIFDTCAEANNDARRWVAQRYS